MNEETKSTIKKADTPPNQAVNELSQFLAPLAEGTLVPDYVQKLHELVQAVGEVRSGGEIILKIKISPMRGTVNQMAVHSEVISKPPAAPKPMRKRRASPLRPEASGIRIRRRKVNGIFRIK